MLGTSAGHPHSSVLTDCQHHFACSNQTTFSAGGTNTGWPYAEFYRSILGVIACMTDDEKEGLLKWWNQ